MLHFPTTPKSPSALSGSDFAQSILHKSGQERDDIIFDQFNQGNIPNWLHQNIVSIKASDNKNTIEYFVMPDVLCIGNEYDFFRVSCSGYTYKKIANLFNASFITPKMSKQIWQAADLKETPITWKGPFTEIMGATSTMIWHNDQIEQQRAGRNFNLISGHKKDMVISKDLLSLPNNICITGWYYADGKQIQPKSARVHSELWTDYADQVRLVSQICFINGQETNFFDVLNNPSYSYLISDEGSFDAKNIYNKI